MTTATVDLDILDQELPDELEQRSYRYVARIKVSEIGDPPARKSAKAIAAGRKVYPEFQLRIEPLSYKLDSNIGTGPGQFEDNYVGGSYFVFNPDGTLVNKGSDFDDIRNGLMKLGFPIKNLREDPAKLVGLIFEWEDVDKPYNQKVINGETGQEEIKVRHNYIPVPIARVPDDYTAPENPRVVQRPRDWRTGGSAGVPAATGLADNSAEAIPALKDILDGKGESEYQMALINSKNSAVLRAPWLTMASTNQGELTEKMVAAGMQRIDGKLTK